MNCRVRGCLQVVNPMPRMMESIVRLRGNGSTPTIGVGAYSEGTNDDLNKAVWSGIAANPNTTIEDLVAQYARYHFGAELEDSMTALLFGLEQNWVGGDIATNTYIPNTLSLAASVLQQANSSGLLQTNWRMQMYLYRAYYDSYVQARFQSETLRVQQAKGALAQMSGSGSRAAIDRARKALLPFGGAQGGPDGPAALKQTCLALFNAMNQSVGVEVIQGQVTSMNIDKIDETTSDVGFLLAELDRFEQMGTETERVSAIHLLLSWEDPGVGGFYDNLAPRSSSGELYGHLNPGQGPKADPGAPRCCPSHSFAHTQQTLVIFVLCHVCVTAYYFSPLTTAEPAKPQNATRLSWQTSAMSFYDAPLILDYVDLEPQASYLLELVFVGSLQKPTLYHVGQPDPVRVAVAKTEAQPVQLLANGQVCNLSRPPLTLFVSLLPAGAVQVLKDYFLPPTPMQKFSVRVPTSATATGSLRIECREHRGLGGTGRTCNIAEVWLRRTE